MENDDMTGTHRIIRALGATATIEAVTWAGLLVGVVLKRVLEVTEVGVQVFGPLHGAAFLAYCVTAVLAWRARQWSVAMGALALLASIPPFGTVVFHRWAARTGRLAPSAPPAPSTAQPVTRSVAPTAQMPVISDLPATGSLPTTGL
jgi:integral membrane protein